MNSWHIDTLARLIYAVQAHITVAYALAFIGAVFYVATLMTRTIVPLRLLGIVSLLFLIAYGVMAGAAVTLMYLISLPINVVRLGQVLNLNKKARRSASGDLSMDWLRPFMTPRKYRRGEVLCCKGDVAKERFLVINGKILITELDIEIPAGVFMGELGFVAPNNRRTQTIKCIEGGNVLSLTYEKLLELIFQNPELGYYFAQLISGRLLENCARLQGLVDEAVANLDSGKPE
jgi:hypothetical protein